MTETHRQLKAARDSRYRRNEHHRYVIDGEARPDRKERERLMGRGWLDWHWVNGVVVGLRITTEGESALRLLEADPDD